jgi:hypothetical protein
MNQASAQRIMHKGRERKWEQRTRREEDSIASILASFDKKLLLSPIGFAVGLPLRLINSVLPYRADTERIIRYHVKREHSIYVERIVKFSKPEDLPADVRTRLHKDYNHAGRNRGYFLGQSDSRYFLITTNRRHTKVLHSIEI